MPVMAITPPLAYEIGVAWLANPVAANNIAIGATEVVAGTSIATGAGRQVFRNLAPADEIVPAIRFSSAQIQQVAYSGRLNYVVTETGDLLLGGQGIQVSLRERMSWLQGRLDS